MRKERDARWIKQSARQKRRMSILCPETGAVKRYVRVLPLGWGGMVPFMAFSAAGSVTEGFRPASSRRLDDTGESERRAVAVEM